MKEDNQVSQLGDYDSPFCEQEYTQGSCYIMGSCFFIQIQINSNHLDQFNTP